MASAEAFTVLKIAGASYLVWLGIKTWRQAGIVNPIGVKATGVCRAFREGIVVEALNPKTAAFFLAFIPQFVDPSADIALQFVVLGTISVGLNTGVDVVATYSAAKARTSRVQSCPGWGHHCDIRRIFTMREGRFDRCFSRGAR
jgi:threonine/homoserine/homoserine lactone efflux protein